jgi:hypothetical protein
MTDNTSEEYCVGLSDEEIDDLARLIRVLKEEPSDAGSEADIAALQKRIADTAKHLIELADMILRFDRAMKSFYEILRLSHKKSEIVNRRIDTVMAWAARIKVKKRREDDERRERTE